MEMFENQGSLGEFNVKFSFPSVNYSEDGVKALDLSKDTKKKCYSQGKLCSIGFLDSRPVFNNSR